MRVTAVAIGLILTIGLHAQQIRDGRGAAAPAQARLAGVVRVDDATGSPVRGAIVTVSGDGLALARTVITDDEGHFAFEAMPAGHFLVAARKAPFLSTTFGAKRPGGPGTPVALTAGQTIDDVVIAMQRGAVITGRVFDASNGMPMVDTPVLAIRTDDAQNSGGSSLRPPFTTDERGVYRIFGLAPGDYVVSAQPRQLAQGEVNGPTEEEIDAALAALQRRPRVVGTAPPAAGEPIGAPARASGFSPVYYPGTPIAADARRLRLSAGQELGGVDMSVARTHTASIEGVVSVPSGDVPAVGLVLTSLGDVPARFLAIQTLTPAVTLPGRDGRFRYINVAPGRYTITARTGGAGPGGRAPAAGAADVLWASADVSVSGDGDVTGVSLALRPALHVTGRVQIDAPLEGAPLVPTTIRVGALREGMPLGASTINGTALGGLGLQSVAARADGTFDLAGLLPGSYRLTISGITGRWWARSAMLDGHDVLDESLVVADADVAGLAVRVTDRHSSLSGSVRSAGGAPVSDLVVVVAPVDRALWRPTARRIHWVRPATDGAFTLADLPPGEYLLAALTDFDVNDVRDASFADQLVAASLKVTISEGASARQDIRLGQ